MSMICLNNLAQEYQYLISAISAIATVCAVIVSLYFSNKQYTPKIKARITFKNKGKAVNKDYNVYYSSIYITNERPVPVRIDRRSLILKIPLKDPINLPFYDFHASRRAEPLLIDGNHSDELHLEAGSSNFYEFLKKGLSRGDNKFIRFLVNFAELKIVITSGQEFKVDFPKSFKEEVKLIVKNIIKS